MAFQVTLHQMIIFFLILLVGFAVGKAGLFKREQMGGLAQIITKVLLPVLIFQGTTACATRENIAANWPIVAFAVAFYVVVAAVLFALAKLMHLKGDRDKVFTFCYLFGNTGFVGIPLLVALFPESGMLYMMLFSIIDQLVFWTFGIWLATARDRKASFSAKSLLTPNLISMILALVFVAFEIPIPDVIGDTLAVIGNATSGMCMIYLGLLVCFSKWMQVIKCKELYVGIAVKMILLPIVGGHLLMAIGGISPDAMVSMVVIMSLPVMTVVPMIASMHGHEGEYATGITVITLVVSVVTIPLVQLLAFL